LPAKRLPAKRLPAKRRRPRAVLLTPGASADRTQPALVAIDDALGAVGIPCARIDLNSRAKPAAVMAVIAEAAAALAEQAGVGPERVVLGGRSFGGRMCSMAVAEGLPALGLALVSYPLHPPGRPDNLRIGHFPALHVPCLFVSGTRDAFGTQVELETASNTIPGPVHHVWLDGSDHALRGQEARVAGAIAQWVAELSA
jgi:predicted alpha/beta-hydrolase family hydrolase